MRGVRVERHDRGERLLLKDAHAWGCGRKKCWGEEVTFLNVARGRAATNKLRSLSDCIIHMLLHRGERDTFSSLADGANLLNCLDLSMSVQ
jgi:hypothetical protein